MSVPKTVSGSQPRNPPGPARNKKPGPHQLADTKLPGQDPECVEVREADGDAEAGPAGPASGEQQYPRPKVLLIDVVPEAAQTLAAAGFNVTQGSFGPTWKVPASEVVVPVTPVSASLPDFTEQEVIAIDLAGAPCVEAPKANVDEGRQMTWAAVSAGIVDPRPLIMHTVAPAFERVFDHGGVFVVFAQPRRSHSYVKRIKRDSKWIDKSQPYSLDNWAFLRCFAQGYLETVPDFGEEMSPGKGPAPLQELITRHLRGGRFHCTLKCSVWRPVVLATNKYKQPVAIALQEGKRGGLILLLPHLRDQAGFLLDLLREALPELRPGLVPDAEARRWIRSAEYGLPAVLQLQRQISAVRAEAERQVRDLEAEMERQEQASAYLYDLIGGSGARLAAAVQKALGALGFQAITRLAVRGSPGAAEEDTELQVQDRSPTLIVTAKGIRGLPSELDALQARGRVQDRILEWSRTDVRGLLVINHQCQLQPLRRENAAPFREAALSAASSGLALITGWDLFRLTRGSQKNGWKPERVLPLFYEDGWVRPVPTHYRPLGVVKQAAEDSVSIEVQEVSLRIGDRVAFELAVDFEEQEVLSLRADSEDARGAKAGDRVQVGTAPRQFPVKAGMRVYRVCRE